MRHVIIGSFLLGTLLFYSLGTAQTPKVGKRSSWRNLVDQFHSGAKSLQGLLRFMSRSGRQRWWPNGGITQGFAAGPDSHFGT